MTDFELYLASQSPRRRELLSQIDIRYRVLPVSVEEEHQPHEPPAAYVERLARAKAMAGNRLRSEDKPVLGADTIVVDGDQILEKPRDEADGKRMLRQLSGRTHLVMTAIAMAQGARCESRLVVTEVSFRRLSDAEIDGYWASGEPRDKAGAYGIQGRAGKFVSYLKGSYSAVVGLPLMETDLLLRQFAPA